MKAVALDADTFLSQWEELETEAELRLFLEQYAPLIDDALFDRMKTRVNELSSSNVIKAVRLAKSLEYAAAFTNVPLHKCWAAIVLGNAARWQGEYQQALSFYDEARTVAEQMGSELEAARSQIGKVHALFMLGQHSEASVLGEKIYQILLAHNQLLPVINLSLNLGLCYYYTLEIDKALEVYNRAIQILEENPALSGREGFISNFKYNISLALATRNRFQEALEAAVSALETQRVLGNQATVAIYQETIGFYYLQLGQFNRALRLMDEAHQVFEASNMQEYIIYCDLFTAQSYIGLNRFDRAKEYCQKALERLKAGKIENNRQGGWANHYLGISLFFLGQYNKAFEAFDLSRQIYSAIGKGTEAAKPTLDMAEFYFRLGENDKAEALALEALTIFRQGAMPGNVASCEVLLGRIYLEQARINEAENLANQALINARQIKIPVLLHAALLLQAEIAEKGGHYRSALDYYLKALTIVEELRGRVAVEQRATFLEDKEVAYEGAVALSLKLSSPAEVLELVMRGKSRGLLDLIEGNLDIRVRAHSTEDLDLVSDLEGCRSYRNELVSRLAYWNSGANISPTGEMSLRSTATENWEDLRSEIEQVERKIGNLVERLQVRNAAYAEDATLQIYEANPTSELMEPDTALIEYYICRDEVLALVITADGLQLEQNLCSMRDIQRGLAAFSNHLIMAAKNIGSGENQRERLRNATEGATANLSKLYNFLLRPLERYIKGYSKLIFVPHRVLHQLPLHALFNQETKKFLIEEREEISYLPSSNLLGICQRRGVRTGLERGRGALVLGYSSNGSLSHCTEEAQAVAELLEASGLEGQNILYLEEAATIRHFESEAGEKLIIHMATHAGLRQDNPLFSALELADGQITALDLLNSQLKAGLITLSACQTGLAKLGGGDELLGLSRACIYAGASTLALSLWKVEDASAARFMQVFYQQILEGKRKGVALRTAQLTLLAQEEYRHPFYWAPFTIVGHTGVL